MVVLEHDGPQSQFSDNVPQGGYGEFLPREFFSHLVNKEMKPVPVMIAAGMYFGLSLLTYKTDVVEKRISEEAE